VGQYGLDGLTEEEREALNGVWSRARPWPDAVPGLARLRRNFLLCTLSNCAFAWLVTLAKGQGLPFDAILASENARAYKPAPEVYEMAIELLGGRAEGLVLVACHNYDLEAARAHGMGTAFLPRKENGPRQTTDQAPTSDWDYVVMDLEGLTDALGC
ncbi:MAG: HAD-IA family hydrolase, partial [Rhodospirillales bacterium]